MILCLYTRVVRRNFKLNTISVVEPSEEIMSSETSKMSVRTPTLLVTNIIGGTYIISCKRVFIPAS